MRSKGYEIKAPRDGAEYGRNARGNSDLGPENSISGVFLYTLGEKYRNLSRNLPHTVATASPCPQTRDSNPPPYVRIVYDETHRGKWYMQLSIASRAHVAHLLGYLEHHTPSTDGSFGVCIASGTGVFVSKVPTTPARNDSPSSDVDTP